MKKFSLKRAKFSGVLDLIGFLAALVMAVGYAVIDWVKVTGLPKALTDVWTKITGGVTKAFAGWSGDQFAKMSNPAIAYTIVFGVLAILFLIMMIGAFKQGHSILRRGSCVFAAILALLLCVACGLLFAEPFIAGKGMDGMTTAKWVMLAPTVFFFLQMILKFSAVARAY